MATSSVKTSRRWRKLSKNATRNFQGLQTNLTNLDIEEPQKRRYLKPPRQDGYITCPHQLQSPPPLPPIWIHFNTISSRKNLLLLPNQVAPGPLSNRYLYLYLSDSDNPPVFNEMVSSNNNLNPINTYSVVPPSVTLVSTPTKVLNNHCNTRHSKKLGTIRWAQSDNTASTRFLSTALHSVSQSIIHDHTYKIALYNKYYTYWCLDSGSSKDIFPDYSTFKTYLHISNQCATLGNTTNITIEGIGTAVYKLNGQTILTRNALCIPELRGPLYSLRKHHQRPGCWVYSS